MESPSAIFVFTDNLSVHRSLSEAAAYHEHPATLRAYDERGRAFEIPMFAQPIPLSGDSRRELIRRLRREVVSLAITRPDLLGMDKWAAKHASEEEIIRLAVRWFSIPEPPVGSGVAATLWTVAMSPFWAALFVLAWTLVLYGLALGGVKRAISGSRPAG